MLNQTIIRWEKVDWLDLIYVKKNLACCQINNILNNFAFNYMHSLMYYQINIWFLKNGQV